MPKSSSMLVRLVAIGILGGGCAPSPVEVAFSDVILRVEPASGRVTILHPDRSPILDGFPGGRVAAGASPHVGFAFEPASPSWSELYGSFHIDDSVPAWQGAVAMHGVTKQPDGLRFALDGPSGGGTGWLRRVADGTVELVVSAPQLMRASATFHCAPDERFIGFGAMPMDAEHRGKEVPIWVSEQGVGRVATDEPPGDWFLRGTRHQSYFPVPFFVSSRGYGVRAETSYKSVFAMCSERADAWRVEAWEGKLALQVFFGPSPLEVIRLHSDLEGRAPPPPAFAFAPWNDAIFGSANVRRIASELRANHIPSSVIWTEDWAGGVHEAGGGYHLPYSWTVDRTLYPDVELLAAGLHASGFKFLGYFNSFVPTAQPSFASGRAGGFLIKQTDGAPYLMEGLPLGTRDALVDLTSDAAKTWMSASLSAALDLGFDGWMADFGEWQPLDAVLASGEPAEAAHDRYPLLWQRLNEQVLKSRQDGVERLTFVRSGHNGSQPVTHQVVWGGDQTTDFDPGDGLPSVLPIMLGLGVAGVPYFGSDIGGYFSGNGHPTATKELFFRWSVLGALSPIMRTHHGSQAGQNWNFDSDAETLAHWKRWAEVHTKLYPYLSQAAAEASRNGAPIARHLALGFPSDPAAWTTNDEYLLGPSLLVAPVLAAGAVERMVYFPSGHWLPLFGQTNGPAVDGPTAIAVATPLGEIPVYAPSGTVLVLLPDGVDTLAPSAPPLVGLTEIGDDREVIAMIGANGQSVETGGQTYALASMGSPGAPPALTWNAVALTACATPPRAPCASVDATAHEASAHVVGDGVLAFADGAAALTTGGGRPRRALFIRFRW